MYEERDRMSDHYPSFHYALFKSANENDIAPRRSTA
jgi:hypothetical protein